VLLVKDENDSFVDNLSAEAILALQESIQIRKDQQQQTWKDSSIIDLSVSNNNMILMNDVYLLSCIHEDCADAHCALDDSDNDDGSGEDKALNLLLAMETDKTFSNIDRDHFCAFMCPRAGLLFERKGDFVKSTAFFEQAIATQRRYLGEAHPTLFQTLLDYGLAHLLSSGDVSVAKASIQESTALRLQHVVGGGASPSRQGLVCLAEGYMAQLPMFSAPPTEDVLQCKALIEKAYHVRCHLYGAGMHTGLAECLVEYGLVCKKLSKYTEAVLYLEESLKVRDVCSLLDLFVIFARLCF
jgi:tetratricopeptide (TPR) repeat protein